MKYRLLILIFLFIGKSYAQNTSASYVAEFNILVESLQELHPTLYTNISKEEFDLQVQTIKTRLAETKSSAEAIYIIQELFYKLGNSHAGNISIYRQDLGVMKALPFSVYILGDQLYIKDYPANESFEGAEIHAIEQTSASDLIDSLKIFFPIDGSRPVISSYMPMMFNGLYGAFCQQKDTFAILTNKGSFYAKATVRGDTLFEKFILKPDAAYFGEDRILKTEITDEYAYFKFIGFVPKYKGFAIEKSFYDLLKTAESKKLNNLVIDLRNNSGGDPYMAGRMASYLADKPFSIFEELYITDIGRPTHLDYMSEKMMYKTRWIRCKKSEELKQVVHFEKGLKKTNPKKNRFTGQIYVLVDGATQSSSTMFCKYLMNQPNVTFVGTETMGSVNYFWAGRHCQITLPVMNTTFSFGLELIELQDGSSKTEPPMGLIPDQIINYTIEDLTAGKDSGMEFIRADIQKRTGK